MSEIVILSLGAGCLLGWIACGVQSLRERFAMWRDHRWDRKMEPIIQERVRQESEFRKTFQGPRIPYSPWGLQGPDGVKGPDGVRFG